jgi:type IV secretion system protein VirD4
MYKLSRLMLTLAAVLFAYCVVLLVIAAALLFGPVAWIVLLVLVCAVVAYRKRRRLLTAFGTAAWASPADLERAGMLSARKGLILGRVPDDGGWPAVKAARALLNRRLGAADACREFFDALNRRKRKQGRLVRLPQVVHSAVFAPTRVGKGVSLVIPFLQTYEESCVAVDPKGELATLTSATRRKMGKVVILDPYKAVTKSPDTLNPLDFIDKNDPLALDQCRALAEALVIRTGEEKEPHWADSAEAVIRAIIATVVMYGQKAQGTRSLQSVRDILSSPQKWEISKKIMREHGGMLARWGGELEHFRGDELSSVLTTSNRFLGWLDTLPIAESTSSSSFDPAGLRRGKMTVYLVLPVEHMRTQSPLLRMWIGTMFQAVVRAGLGETNKVHFVLDEAAALGHMQQLDDAVDKYAGYGVRLQFYYQSLGQLKKCWPSDQGQTLLSNTTKVFFGTNDIQTAQFLSQSLGNETIIVDSGGTNEGTSRQHSASTGGSYSTSTSTSHSSGSSNNWQQQTRELLKPDEILNLSPRTAITLTPGVRPIWSTLLRYYEETKLLKPRRWWRRAIDACRTFIRSAALLALFAVAAAVFTFELAAFLDQQKQVPASPYPAPATGVNDPFQFGPNPAPGTSPRPDRRPDPIPRPRDQLPPKLRPGANPPPGTKAPPERLRS